jgi:hypothetical protein
MPDVQPYERVRRGARAGAPISARTQNLLTRFLSRSISFPGMVSTPSGIAYVPPVSAARTTETWVEITAVAGTAAPFLYSASEVEVGTWADVQGGLSLVGKLKSIPESTMEGYAGHLAVGARVKVTLGQDGNYWTESYGYNQSYGWGGA